MGTGNSQPAPDRDLTGDKAEKKDKADKEDRILISSPPVAPEATRAVTGMG